MKTILILSFLFLLQGAFAQKEDSILRHNEGNVYFQAIDQYIHYREQENKKTDTLFLEEGAAITDSILSECHHTKLVKLDEEQLKDLLNKRESVNLYRILPIQTGDQKISVTLIPFGCGYNKVKKKYEFLYGGKYIAVFKFDGIQILFQQMEEHGI